MKLTASGVVLGEASVIPRPIQSIPSITIKAGILDSIREGHEFVVDIERICARGEHVRQWCPLV